VSNFVMQALKGEEITIYGDGGQTRSFCYVDDLVEGLVKLMNGPDEFTGPVNLGNPEEYSILGLAEVIIRLTGSRSRIAFKTLPEDDPKQRQPDITLAKEKLNWQPSVSLSVGLAETISYFRKLVGS
jgi:UDP-glucuronate decarboxylase